MMQEEWKTLVYYNFKSQIGPLEYPNYEINNKGDIRNKKTGKQLKAHDNTKGYLTVRIYPGPKRIKIHRAVACTFLPNTDYFLIPHHKDDDKKNNKVTNLEWVTHSENSKHAILTGAKKAGVTPTSYPPKAVKQMDKDSHRLIAIYSSTMDAERQTGCHHQAIVRCCQKKSRTAGNYYWEYVD